MKYSWWTYSEIQECKDMYRNGKTIQEIAKELDRSELSIRNLLETERVEIV